MPVEPIRKAGPDDAASMSAALAAAFYADPFFRWMLPDDDHRAAALPEFFALVVDVLAVHDAWTRLAGVHADRMLGLFELADQHHPAESHEYLFFVGVQPDSQGRGVGQALTLPVLERADAAGHPCYLEASSTGSRRLYERLGFQAVNAITASDGPTFWPMVRNPQRP